MVFMHAITTLLYIPVHSIPCFLPSMFLRSRGTMDNTAIFHVLHINCDISSVLGYDRSRAVGLQGFHGIWPRRKSIEIHAPCPLKMRCLHRGHPWLFSCALLMVRAHDWGKMYFQGLLRAGLENQGLWVFFVAQLLFSRCVLRGFHVYVRDPNRMVDIWFSNCCRRSSARKTLPWWQNVKEDGQEERIVGHKKIMLELDIHTFSKAKAMSKTKTLRRGSIWKQEETTLPLDDPSFREYFGLRDFP